MKNSVVIVIIILLITFCSNNKTEKFQKVELGEACLNSLNLSMFRGIYPSIYLNKVHIILGQPDEKFVINDIDEPRVDLAYYNERGRLLLHWSGEIIDEIGMIEFRPKRKLFLKNVYPKEIRVHKNILRIDCNQKYKFYIFLNKNLKTVKKIEWWFE